MNKNKQISKTIKLTREKRQSQVCRSYQLKIDRSHLSNDKARQLKMLFVEAKWLYNYQLSLPDDKIFDRDWKNKKVTVLNKDKQPEAREIIHLGSQVRQAIIDRIMYNIKGLSQRKKKGGKIGKLKFKSRVESIPLVQYGVTYRIKGNKYIKIQGIKQRIKINGLKQIPDGVEYASAVLTNRGKDYWLKVTCYLPKIPRVMTGKSIGLDFGIKTALTTSDGKKYDIQLPETKRVKTCQKQVAKTKKGSSNRWKARERLEKAYYKLDCQKKDIKNKIVHEIVTENDIVCFQDENIKGWHHGWFGKAVQHSVLGGIISDLKFKSHTPSIVDRFFPSTKLCSRCGSLNSIGLEERVYRCDCGYEEDRDIHSARNILIEGLSKLNVPREPRDFKPVEMKPLHGEYQSMQVLSMKQEATAL